MWKVDQNIPKYYVPFFFSFYQPNIKTSKNFYYQLLFFNLFLLFIIFMVCFDHFVFTIFSVKFEREKVIKIFLKN